MRLVIVETPYAAPAGHPDPAEAIAINVTFARACLRDCIARGEAPFASHLLYTQEGVLDDGVPEQRATGIAAGLEWGKRADATVVYLDHGMSGGMSEGIKAAHLAGRPVEFRTLYRGVLSRL